MNPIINEFTYKYIKNAIKDTKYEEILENYELYRYYVANFLLSHNLNEEDRRKIGSKFNETFFGCRFNMDKCKKEDFETYIDSYYGLCYIFGRKSSKAQITRSGKMNGFNAMLYLDHIDGADNLYAFTMNLGLHVFISNQSVPFTFNDGVDIGTDMETFIVLSRHFVRKMARPYSDCIDNMEKHGSMYVRKIFELNMTYTQKYCFNLGFQKLLAQKCNCIDRAFPHIHFDKPFCDNISDFRCITQEQQYFLRTV
jgi:hypothetical protein